MSTARHLVRERRPRSRGRVCCSVCLGRIPVGVRYLRQTVRAQGRISDWLVCPGCEDLVPDIVCLSTAPDRACTPEDADEWARHQVSTRGDRQVEAIAFLERRLAPTLTQEKERAR